MDAMATPEDAFRAALRKLIGSSSEAETQNAVVDLQTALQQLLEKRDAEWRAILEQKGTSSPKYDSNVKLFASDIAHEIVTALDRRLDERIAAARLAPAAAPAGRVTVEMPSNVSERIAKLEANVGELEKTIRTKVAAGAGDALHELGRDEVKQAFASGDRGDELSKLITQAVKEIHDDVMAAVAEDVKAEVRAAIKEEVKRDVLRDLA